MPTFPDVLDSFPHELDSLVANAMVFSLPGTLAWG
jgi:hypothetical protein